MLTGTEVVAVFGSGCADQGREAVREVVKLREADTVVFCFGFRRIGESCELLRELSVRLSRASEFSLLVAFPASSIGTQHAPLPDEK